MGCEFKVKTSSNSDEYVIFSCLEVICYEITEGMYSYNVVAEPLTSGYRRKILKVCKTPKSAFSFLKKLAEKYPDKDNFLYNKKNIPVYQED